MGKGQPNLRLVVASFFAAPASVVALAHFHSWTETVVVLDLVHSPLMEAVNVGISNPAYCSLEADHAVFVYYAVGKLVGLHIVLETVAVRLASPA